MRLRTTGVYVFRSPFHNLTDQTNRGGFSIYRKFRVEMATRSAYPFGTFTRCASGRRIRDFVGTTVFTHCVALPCVCSFPGVYPVVCAVAFRPGVFLLWNRGTFRRKIPPLLEPLLERRTPPVSCIPFCRVSGGRLLLPPMLGAFDTPDNRTYLIRDFPVFPISFWFRRMRSTHQSPNLPKDNPPY